MSLRKIAAALAEAGHLNERGQPDQPTYKKHAGEARREIAANVSEMPTASDAPTRKMMREIAGAFAEYEKARLVHKLRDVRASGSARNVIAAISSLGLMSLCVSYARVRIKQYLVRC